MMKRLMDIMFLLLLATVSAAQPAAKNRRADMLRLAGEQRPTVAVVLSGGGAKGVAHIAALRAVEEAGIPVDIVCGTSIGSLIGALYAIGYSPDQLDSIVRLQNWAPLLTDWRDPSELTLQQRQEQNTYAIIRQFSSNRPDQGGLLRGRNIERLFRQLCQGYLDSISFDSLPIRFACVASDIVSNSEVDFRSGSLITAMRASMAIPGAFTPVRMGDSVLVDGGLTNNYPADLAQRMGADIIIGVSVQGKPLKAGEINDAVAVFNQLIDINTKKKYEENVAVSDVMMVVDVDGYSAASFNAAAIDTLLRRGAEEAARHRDDLLALAARIQGSTHPAGKKVRPESSPADSLGYKPSHVPIDKASRAKAAAYHRPTPSRHIGRFPIASVGFRFDIEDMGALQLNYKKPLHIVELSGTLRLGRHLAGIAQLTFFPRSFTNPTLSYSWRQRELDIYTNGERTHNTKYRHQTADFSPLNFKFHNVTVSAGLRWDYFNYYGRLLSSATDSLGGFSNNINTDDHYHFSYHLSADVNTENHWYFPSRGTRLHFDHFYRTDNLIGIDNHFGISEPSLLWRTSFSPLPRLTFRLSAFARILFADSIPLAYRNTVGGHWFGHLTGHQMPFPGVFHTELTGNIFAALQLNAQVRIAKNHYVVAAAAVGVHDNSFSDLFNHRPLLGSHFGYSYNTPFGPIDVRIGYSNLSTDLNYIVSIGHYF